MLDFMVLLSDINNNLLIQYGWYKNAVTNTECTVTLPISHSFSDVTNIGTNFAYEVFLQVHSYHDMRQTAKSEVIVKTQTYFTFWSGSYNDPHTMWFTIGF
ncbi:MAG: hypothetical protein IJ272_04465 [Clostridia bacterium]|nr:hypothetical protein [Clostridia bacterium]